MTLSFASAVKVEGLKLSFGKVFQKPSKVLRSYDDTKC